METGKRGILIVAGGCGCRMGAARPKQFLLLDGMPVLAHTINRFARTLPGAPLVVVLPAGQEEFWHNLAARFDVASHLTATGGATRYESVKNGLAALPGDCDLILVHDGVRPLVSADLIRHTAACAERYAAAIPVVEPVDSYRRLEDGESRPIDRSRLRIVQTPQAFNAEVLRSAYENPYEAGFTDDASVVERMGHTVFLCEGERSNLKITTPEDLAIAQALLEAERERTESAADETAFDASAPQDAGASARPDAGAGTDHGGQPAPADRPDTRPDPLM